MVGGGSDFCGGTGGAAGAIPFWAMLSTGPVLSGGGSLCTSSVRTGLFARAMRATGTSFGAGGCRTGVANTTGWIGEVDYMPFNHGGPSFWPWLNVKLGVQYIYYDKFAGGVNNFDGAGRNAHDNNTLFFFAWMAF